MASLALGVVGAGIGSVVGGPAGARLGFSIGTVLGGILFPPKSAPQDIGRLADYPASGSTYGAMIEQVFGAFRVGGNIIECTPLVESVKKKGSKLTGTTTRTYSYTSTMAVLFGRGPIGIRRIWAEDRVIYDYRAYPPSPHTLRVYRGSALQAADSALVALHGAGGTPGYRNRVYCVIENMNLADWANRIPNYNAELADDTYPERVIRAGALIYFRFDDAEGKLSDSGTKVYTLTESPAASSQVRGCFTYLGQQGGEGLHIPAGNAVKRVIGNDLALQVSTFTVEGWFKYKGGAPVDGSSVFEYIGTGHGEFPWSMKVQPNVFTTDTIIQLNIHSDAAPHGHVSTSVHTVTVARDTNWHHLLISYSGTGNSVLYYDGVAQSTVAAPINPVSFGTPDAASYLNLQTGDYDWDELAYYPSVLTAADALAHYNSGAGL